jgi:hypothetical protein
MEKRVRVMIGVACALACTLARANAQVNVTVNSNQMTDAYMSWSPTAYTLAHWPGDGGSAASGWSLPANPAVFSSGNTLTISPNVNTYAAGNTYWTNPDGSGANTMDAATYSEVDGGLYAGQSVTFTFNVLSNTLGTDAYGDVYTADAFIKDFGPGYSYNGEQTVALTGGVESVTYPMTGNNPGEIVQYGVELIGADANPATVSLLGDVVIAPVPEPSTIGLVVCGMLGALAIRRRKA